LTIVPWKRFEPGGHFGERQNHRSPVVKKAMCPDFAFETQAHPASIATVELTPSQAS
jgi:hypothetical protein